ncbi:S8 family serine peptidase [Candidatus Sumerlaeota bacterium]|nr:S8 family serine peptidase [Candidatus Sumerlaeota bacterium]
MKRGKPTVEIASQMIARKRTLMMTSRTVAGALLLAAAMTTGGKALAVDPRAEGLGQPWAADVVSLKLLNEVEQRTTGKSLSSGVIKDSPVRTTTGGNILCEATIDKWGPGTAAQFAIKGVNVIDVSEKYRRVTLELVDPNAVYELAKLPNVVQIEPCYGRERRAGIVTAQSYVAMNVDKAISRYGVTGAGQKVGVISDSFAATNGVRQASTTPGEGEPGILQHARNQDSGDLPPQVQILRDIPALSIFGQASDEGAGMAELVHDLAPGADIAFHTAYISETNFAEGITALRNAGSTVVVDDVIYFAEPMYQDGPVAQAARECVAAGVPYFSAAGNGKNLGLKFNFRDYNPSVDTEGSTALTTDDYHRWDNGTPFLAVTFLPFNTTTLILQWNQPYASVSPGNGSQVDLDIVAYLGPSVDSGGAGVINDIQGTTGSPRGNPLEILQYTNFTNTAQTFYIAINHVRGMQDGIPQSPSTPLECRLVAFGALPIIEGITSNTAQYGGPTIFGHATAEGVMAVGAVPWYDTPNFNTDLHAGPGIDPQDFTSRGGNLTIQFSDSGAYAPRARYVPDIAATQGDNTTFFGGPLDLLGYQGEPDNFPNFFGTSAAAPNAAAIAALMLDMKPELTPAEVSSIMRSTAIDVIGRRGAPGVDDVTGAGLVDAQRILEDIAGNAGITPIPTPVGTPAQRFRQQFVAVPSSDPEIAATQSTFDGWVFESGGASFIAPTPGDALGSPVLTTTDNTNTFGFFSSPSFVAGAYERVGDIPMNGNNGATNLYRADFVVRSSVEDRGTAPTIRFRATTESNEQSDMLVISSTGEGVLSPIDPLLYRLYFTLPPTQKRFRLFYEVINVGGTDAANVNLILDRVDVTAISVNGLIDQQTVRNYDFRGPDSHGWTFRDAQPIFPAPQQAFVADGLRLGPATTASTVSFGYFGSPEDDGNAPVFNPSRVYRARFKVRSNLNVKSQVPTFRLRVNSFNNDMSAMVSVDSPTDGANVPAGGQLLTYDLYYETLSGIDFSRMNFSFDYIMAPGLGNNAAGTVTLELLEVSSFQIPLL